MTQERTLTRRRLLYTTGATVSAVFGAGLYGWRIEPHWLQLVERRLFLQNLPKELIGARVVQLSDLHIGPLVDGGYLRRVFDCVKQLKPEIVLYTGDFLNYNADIDTHGRMMACLPLGTRATLGVLGNHDYGPGWSHPRTAERIAALADHRGVRILRNEVADVSGLQVVGLDDLWGQARTPLMK